MVRWARHACCTPTPPISSRGTTSRPCLITMPSRCISASKRSHLVGYFSMLTYFIFVLRSRFKTLLKVTRLKFHSAILEISWIQFWSFWTMSEFVRTGFFLVTFYDNSRNVHLTLHFNSVMYSWNLWKALWYSKLTEKGFLFRKKNISFVCPYQKWASLWALESQSLHIIGSCFYWLNIAEIQLIYYCVS